jgi:hypothetical protein
MPWQPTNHRTDSKRSALATIEILFISVLSRFLTRFCHGSAVNTNTAPTFGKWDSIPPPGTTRNTGTAGDSQRTIASMS